MEYFSIDRLELPKIISWLANQCSSPLGKDLVAQVQPLTDKNAIIALLEETTQAREILRLYPNFSLGGIRDISHSLWRVSRGAVLTADELLAVLDTLEAVRRIKKFFRGIKEEFCRLRVWNDRLNELQDIQIAIKSAISEDGQVKDEASPDLFRLRRKIIEVQERIKGRLDQILRSPEYQRMLQDPLITMRGDRYVLPVKQEYRSRFPGIVHDQSASGATLFIEPMPVVELNNDLRNFQLAEKREIEAILTGLTKIIAGCISELEDNLQSLARLDFIFAKGKLSQAMDGCQPELNTEGLVHIKKGRHPLLVGEVVPIDIHLGRDFRVLVITGPNTGGKTVALKTVGLLCLMAQCGMHIPAEPGTELAVFQSIFADIGDEQSIEQSLSTFSGHMTNIVQIMNKIKLPSLVLLDELGAGTDPVEGSALAIAILKKLRSLQAHTIATTHYSELKAFAYNTPGVENASVEFDPVTLRPTYRLLIGMPGRSNAFEIAARLGLAPEVVAEARSLISRDELEIGHLLKDLEAKRKSLDRDREEVDKIREELAALRHNLEAEKRRLHEKEEKIIAEAYRRSESIIKKGQQEISSLIKMLKEQMEKIDRKEQEKSIQQAREQLKELKKTARQQLRSLQPSDPGRIPRKIKPGDLVFVTKLQKQGRIIGVSGGQGPVQVQIGILKVEVPWEDLREIDEPKTVIESNSINAGIMVQKSEEISPEIDLRGCTVEEALEELSKFFDDVLLSNLTTVYLIHGKGTGALRTAIGEYLRDHPRVKNFRLGYQNEGGSGVTVVEFKD